MLPELVLKVTELVTFLVLKVTELVTFLIPRVDYYPALPVPRAVLPCLCTPSWLHCLYTCTAGYVHSAVEQCRNNSLGSRGAGKSGQGSLVREAWPELSLLLEEAGSGGKREKARKEDVFG